MKKFLLTSLSLILVAAIAIGGTMAYLTDTDSDVNVMTLGNVKIAQHEYQRVIENGAYKTDTIDNQTSYVLEAFEQGKALLPATDPSNNGAGTWDSTTVRMSQVDSYGGMQVFVNPNAQDKFVTVENTGKTDAYVRTLVAIECGSGDVNLIGSSYHSNWSKNAVGKVEINENTYYVYEYIYKGASDGSRHVGGVLPAGETSYPNLSQVYLKSVATNEDMAAIDGNGNGTLDILVVSQAVQAAGFADAQTALDTAFGEITATNNPWADGVTVPTVVTTAAELEAALKAGENVVLANDITMAAHITSTNVGNININGNGNTLNIRGIYSVGGKNITLSNVTLVDEWTQDYAIYNQGGKVELTNVTYNGNINKAIQMAGGGEVILTDCSITGNVTGSYSASNIWCGDGRTVTVNGGTYGSIFMNVSEGANILSASKITVNDGTIGKLILETEKNTKTGDGTGYKSATLVQNGGTITELVENPQNYDLSGLTKLN
ncbi:MAG: hypothetical protein II306_03640 [Clostridia bacterium]|nr:hypothetical protein [Clostridia bacterium]